MRTVRVTINGHGHGVTITQNGTKGKQRFTAACSCALCGQPYSRDGVDPQEALTSVSAAMGGHHREKHNMP